MNNSEPTQAEKERLYNEARAIAFDLATSKYMPFAEAHHDTIAKMVSLYSMLAGIEFEKRENKVPEQLMLLAASVFCLGYKDDIENPQPDHLVWAGEVVE